MPNSLSATGLTTATQSELLAQYTASLQLIYGADINLESDTPDGQEINIFIQAVLDLEDLLTQIYNSFDPDNAIGAVLDQRVSINGIQRQAATNTTTFITVVTSQTVNLYGLDQTIQPVYTVQDNAGNQFQLVATQLAVTAGTNSFLFQAAIPGQVLTVPNTINLPVTIVLGVTSVNNPSTYATLGINEESDLDLKIRRQKSVGLPSQGYFQGLIAALENINGINSALVIENTGATIDSDGIPGHSIWVIVDGVVNIAVALVYNSATTYQYGSIASSGGINYISVANNNLDNLISDTSFWALYNPIAQAIYVQRNAGCGMKYNAMDSGANSYTITQIDGSAFNIYWYTVVNENLYGKFIASSIDGKNAPNVAGIISSLTTNLNPGVNQEVNINELATLTQIADPNTFVSSAGFSFSSGSGYSAVPFYPSAKNNRFSPTFIVLPIILSCPSGTPHLTLSGGLYLVDTVNVVVVHGNSIQFTPLGGLGSYTYAVISGAGSINGSGLYTSLSAGTDIVQVTDSLSNTATATVTVT